MSKPYDYHYGAGGKLDNALLLDVERSGPNYAPNICRAHHAVISLASRSLVISVVSNVLITLYGTCGKLNNAFLTLLQKQLPSLVANHLEQSSTRGT